MNVIDWKANTSKYTIYGIQANVNAQKSLHPTEKLKNDKIL